MSSSAKLLVATYNKGKLKEILRIFGLEIPELELFTLEDFPGADDVEEVGDTFEANALLKARAGFSHSKIPTLGDDSGLMVDALEGRPGIYSARYSGESDPLLKDQANIRKILSEMEAVDQPLRTARFVTVAAFVAGPTKADEILVRGELEGVIVSTPRGEGGFGYDPIFEPIGMDKTLAELPAHEKDEISHRGRALRKMAPLLGLRFAEIQRPVE
ncbi:MAG: RdgB/HAM1 family non-canonical purine NTP pyrophosphatase [Candidatus Nanopelagicaceae bacterium]